MKKRIALILSISLVVLVLCVFTIPLTKAQHIHKRILTKHDLPNEPVEITDIQLNGHSVAFKRDFDADDDWLRGITFKVKNISGKTIQFLEIDVKIPRSPKLDTPIIIPIPYGQKTSFSNGNPQRIADQGFVTVALTDQIYM